MNTAAPAIAPPDALPQLNPQLDVRALAEEFRRLQRIHIANVLTEHAAMLPASSVSGLYFVHPQARYFSVGRLGEDQIASYARRKGQSLEEVERWLSSSLAYDRRAAEDARPADISR